MDSPEGYLTGQILVRDLVLFVISNPSRVKFDPIPEGVKSQNTVSEKGLLDKSPVARERRGKNTHG